MHKYTQTVSLAAKTHDCFLGCSSWQPTAELEHVIHAICAPFPPAPACALFESTAGVGEAARLHAVPATPSDLLCYLVPLDRPKARERMLTQVYRQLRSCPSFCARKERSRDTNECLAFLLRHRSTASRRAKREEANMVSYGRDCKTMGIPDQRPPEQRH